MACHAPQFRPNKYVIKVAATRLGDLSALWQLLHHPILLSPLHSLMFTLLEDRLGSSWRRSSNGRAGGEGTTNSFCVGE